MKEHLASIGIPTGRVEWRPTYAEDAGTTPLPTSGGIAFVGRLDSEKGVEFLLAAWTPAVRQRWGRLTIAGDGPLAGLVADKAAQDPSVEWRGSLDRDGVRGVIRESKLVALPSRWFEGFPRVAAEAMSLGRPLLMWSGAGFSRVAEHGAGWALGLEASEWSQRLLSLDEVSLADAGRAARAFYEKNCSPAVALQQLQRIYESAAREASGV